MKKKSIKEEQGGANIAFYFELILTDAALLKRQKKEIEELRAKLQVYPSCSIKTVQFIRIKMNYNPNEGRGSKKPVSKEVVVEELLEVIKSTKPDNFTPRVVEKKDDYIRVDLLQNWRENLIGFEQYWQPLASDSMKNMKPEDLRRAAEQLKSTQPDEMAEPRWQMQHLMSLPLCNPEKLLGQDLISCSVEELSGLDNKLEHTLRTIRTRKNQLFKEQVEKLKAKIMVSLLEFNLKAYKTHPKKQN
ncbi:hypothetical protein LXL04_016179 [Taraxacum kok-saghyz]